MPRRSWHLRIEDTLHAIDRIREYVSSLDRESFFQDQRTVDAVIRNLEVVGEAARHVPEEIQSRYSSLPWSEMRAMRNLLAHAYFLVDLDVVWKTVQDDLPVIRPTLQKILDEDP